ncbi:hypothetical protein BCON_0399g00050 [Botryotinia convoluta]|uniref:Uncharacterized protein n=1 Tax=Botryotinia convoluta TaxID=54673 RepID=A0A4Z1HF51_9HELO|nr:hypothetical protein BCON_0399g00050 [Botryotinia convoluta]
MECKTSARIRHHEEAAKHPEILRKMQELGLGQEDIDHFEKVTSSFPASRRVLELVRAREKNERLRREEVREELRRMEGEDEEKKQIEQTQESDVQSNKDNSEVIPPATLASSVESPIVEHNDSAEKEHETTQLQPMAKKVKIPQPGVILVKKKTLQPPTNSTELGNPRPIVILKVVQRDELAQPQPQGPADKETTPQPSTKPTELNNPTPDIAPGEEVQIAELPERHLEAPIKEANFTPPEPKSHELQATPPNSAYAPEETPPPEKLTDNIHLDLDEEWEWAEESERVFGEVVLAPSFGCQTGDEWIVVGSWEQ